jgi:tetratricopeptide (TPR) repeat protein
MKKMMFVCFLTVFVLAFLEAPGDTEKITRVHLKDGRTFEGELIEEIEDAIKLKVELGTIAFPREDIAKTETVEVDTAALAEKKRAANTYTSLLLDFQILKPEKYWHFKQDPPSPLKDVMVNNYRIDARISVSVQLDPHPTAPFNEQTLAASLPATEAWMTIYFHDIKRLSSTPTTFKEMPAFSYAYSAKKKDTGEEYVLETLMFRRGDRIFAIDSNSPKEHADTVREAYQAVCDSFALVEPQEVYGNRYVSREHFFAVERPADWAFVKFPDKQAVNTYLDMTSSDRKVRAAVLVETYPTASPDVKTLAKSFQKKGREKSKDYSDMPPKPVLINGFVGQQLDYTWTAPEGKTFVRATILAEGTRAYTIIIACLDADRQKHEKLFGTILQNVRILRDIMSKGSLETGMAAIQALNEADSSRYANKVAEALPLYEKALELFPRFATAYNNMGVARAKEKNNKDAMNAFQKALELFPEDPTVRGNMAWSHIRQANEFLRDGKYSDAGSSTQKALAMSPHNEDVKESAAALYHNIGCALSQKRSYESAIVWFKRALTLRPKEQACRSNIAIALTNAAIMYYNKGNRSKARAYCQQALKYDPQNGQAGSLLEAIEKPGGK